VAGFVFSHALPTTSMKTKVLVIDDDSAIREGLALALGFGGYAVRTRASAADLEAIIDAWQPALIVLDVLLSGEDGRDAARRLKRSKRYHHVPVLLMSAHPSARNDSVAAGADAFLEKPFDLSMFLREVARLTSP
jgi:two-component system, OmpR family, phosphate regulon response regulator PhoB